MGNATPMEEIKNGEVTCELYGIESLIQHYGIIQAAINAGDPVLRYLRSGRGEPDKILKYFTGVLGTPVSVQENDEDTKHIFADKHTYLDVQVSKIKTKTSNSTTARHIELDFVTTNKEMYEKLEKQANTLLQYRAASNSVLALTNTPAGLALSTIGVFNQKLLTENYSTDVIKGYEHLTSCLKSKTPCGRLSLLQGAPGTGKSYMIRALVSNIDATFIIVGSSMIADLSGPSILSILLGIQSEGKPIAFILEDADVAVGDRKKGGIDQLSGLLNLGDGLLGEMLDVRIIATTNAGRLDLDKAITRPGRMCQHITFDALTVNDSNSLYAKLVGDTDTQIKKALTLAEIYRMAREDGWVPPKPAKVEGQYI